MPAKKKRTVYSKETIAGIVARLDAGETGAAVSRDTGIGEGTISNWKRRAEKAKSRAPKKTARATAKPAANGNGSPLMPEPGPTIEIKGLRAWVRAEVHAELKRRFGGEP